MRKAVANDIKLYSEIFYIDEFIPEQSSKQNSWPSLLIPPFILLHMLELLCSRHADTMRLQRVLDHIQVLVDHDQGGMVLVSLRDISWEILGIC